MRILHIPVIVLSTAALSRVILAVFLTISFQCGAANLNLDDLLKQVQTGRVKDSKENAVRLKAFTANKSQQTKKLAAMKTQQKSQEKHSEKLEADFGVNEKKLVALNKQLKDRLGNLKELFGVLQQAAGDTRGQFDSSLTHIQFPDRGKFLTELANKMGQSSKLASIAEIEKLWFEMQREMTESAKIVRFKTKVITAQGEEETRQVIRIGLFNVVSQGKYLQFIPETGNLVELGRQPQSRYLDHIDELEQASSGMVGFAVDPSRGQLLSLLVQSPGFIERIKQGGLVGYIILFMGLIALLLASERLLVLWMTGRRVNAQVKEPNKAQLNNPLGRVLSVYEANPDANTETLELKLSEAVLKETTGLNRSLMFLKVIAVVAPLMGLLGTVTGMIVTFQAITLFGTGDPKLMAGGISQALVTTVLGLCVAIPTVFLHTLAVIRSKRISHILEEQATGMVAERSESKE